MDHSVIFTQIAQNSFIHKISKNKAHTWKEHLLNTWNGNLQMKSTTL